MYRGFGCILTASAKRDFQSDAAFPSCGTNDLIDWAATAISAIGTKRTCQLDWRKSAFEGSVTSASACDAPCFPAERLSASFHHFMICLRAKQTVVRFAHE